MSYTVKFKLTEEEHRVVLASAGAVGLSVDRLAYQALAYVLRQARQLQEQAHGTESSPQAVDQADPTTARTGDLKAE